MRPYYILLLIFLLVNSINGQNHICGVSRIKSNVEYCLKNNHLSTYNSNSIIKLIVEKIAINPNTFQFISCDHIENAIALIHPESHNRIVMYDNNYFSSITGNDYWFKVFVLSHEIAHHLNGHTIQMKNNYESYIPSQKRELDCDYFAGHILYKLGARESDIVKVFDQLPDALSENESHPKNYKRLNYALKGFNDELNRMKEDLDQYSEYIRGNIQNENILSNIKEIYRNIDEYNKTNEIKYIQIADNLINHSGLKNESKLERTNFFIDYKLERFDKALNFAKKKYFENPNEENCNNILSLLTHAFMKDPIINEISKIESKNSEINFTLGLYYKQNGEDELSNKYIFKAYEIIKNNDESILKSDILIAYARANFEINLAKKDLNNFTLSKIKFLEAKKILDKYPDDDYYRFYYNSLIYHLGTINFLENNCYGVEKYYTELIERVKSKNMNENNENHLFKSFLGLSRCSESSENKFKTLQYYSDAIQLCKNNEHLSYFYSKRATFYKNENQEKLAIQDFEKACKYGDQKACELISNK
jgi:tetratricopeptide (TPR) repeat protein